MRPGITIQHAKEISREVEVVRSDVTAFLGLVPRARWPKGMRAGDYLELPLSRFEDLAENPARRFFDRVTRRAAQSFFLNGGSACRLYGLCVESERDLVQRDAFSLLFDALFDRLRGDEDLGLLAMPILAYVPLEVQAGRPVVACQPTIELLLEHCREVANRFMILDPPRDLHGQALLQWVGSLRDKLGEAAGYGAIYYPWLMNGDESFPPSGSMAGIFARLETEHAPFGVRWPPANVVVRGVTHPALPVRWRESDDLLAHHVNPILTQPSRGVVVWGARTLSRDPRWMHINGRRIVSFIAEQLRRDSEWVVFEHQRPELWEIVSRTVRARLDMLWNAGLLSGDLAGSEYQVQCDAEINPPEVREAGQINVRVTLRPISTAEYIVVELRLGG